MNGLIEHWFLSCLNLKPLFFAHFIQRASKKFMEALWLLIKLFGWVFAIDFIFVGFFGNKIIEFMANVFGKNIVTLHPLLMIGMFVIGVMTLFMQVLLLLFMRREHFLLNPVVYIRAYIVRYFQFILFIGICGLFLRLLLLATGLVLMPQIHGSLLFIMKVFEVFTLFYWLDSNHTIKSLFRSFERGANLLFYSLPFVFITGALSFALFAFLIGLCFGFSKILQVPYALTSFIEFFVNASIKPQVWQIFVIKYGRFLLDGLTVAFLYTWYRRKRGIIYSAQLFDGSKVQE